MQNNLLLFNISNDNVRFINELKYKVRNRPKEYALDTAKEVESVFIQILLKSMRNSLSKNSLIDSNQSYLYTDVYDQQISREMTQKGIGLRQMILKQIESKKY